MKRSRSIVGIAAGVSSLVLVVAGVISYRAVEQLARTSEAVLRAKELELSLERLLSSVRDAETGQRGFLLSGSEEYLAPYTEALKEIDGRLVTVEARVDAHVDVEGSSEESLFSLRRLVEHKLAEMARTIELFRADRRVAAIALLNSDEGKLSMDAIRTLVGQRAELERRHVEELLSMEQRALRASTRSSVAVAVLAILLMIALMYVVRRDSWRLRQSEERLATTLRSIGDAVIATDEQGLVTLTNPVAEKLTGWTLAEASGKPLEEVFRIVNEQTRVTVESPVTKVLREGGIVGLANHTVLIGKSGDETAIEDSGAPILDSAGNLTGVVLVFRDATQERAAQNALIDADRRKDEFLATLAHELRNPLAPIRQAASLAAHGGASGEQIRWSLGVIERQASHMARLLDDLLDVSRITRGHLEVRKSRVELREIVEAALETAQPYVDAAKHRLAVELPAEPLYLEVDGMRISQVLANLLTNAAKYTPAGGDIRLVVRRDGERVRISVIDNGIGVAATQLPQIFEMFAQVKPTLDRKEAGLGIGLALSKALVELNEGTLEGRSEGLGKGSEFLVTLRLSADQEPAPQGPDAPAQDTGASDLPKIRVMLADDNRDACDSLEMLLTLEGYEVRAAHDGRSALALMEEFRPDLALLDIGMPEMNGYELATEVRQHPWGANIRLVAVTGWGQAEDRRRSLSAGFDAHLVKPVDFADVRALCEEFAGSVRAE